MVNIDRYGNTTGGTIPLGLRDAVEQGPRLHFPEPKPKVRPSDDEITALARILNQSKKITILGLEQRTRIHPANDAARIRIPAQNSRARAVPEQTRADEHPGVIVKVKRRAAYLHAHRQNSSASPGRQQRFRGPQVRQRRAATLTDQIQGQDVMPESKPFAHVTGQARTKVARAGADDDPVDLVALEPGIFQGRRRCLFRQRGRVPGKARVHRIRGQIERFGERVQGQVPGRDAIIAEQNLSQNRLRAAGELGIGFGGL